MYLNKSINEKILRDLGALSVWYSIKRIKSGFMGLRKLKSLKFINGFHYLEKNKFYHTLIQFFIMLFLRIIFIRQNNFRKQIRVYQWTLNSRLGSFLSCTLRTSWIKRRGGPWVVVNPVVVEDGLDDVTKGVPTGRGFERGKTM